MIKNFDAQATTINGTPLKNGDKAVLLKDIIIEILCANFQDEQDLPGHEKFARGQLAAKVNGGGDINLSAKELALIETLVGKGGSVPIIFQVFTILNEDAKPVEAI